MDNSNLGSTIDSSKLIILDAANIESDKLTSINYAIITHNNTLQCFVEKIRPTTIGTVKTRFQNCAILCLKLYLTGDNNKGKYELKLVYDGEINSEEKGQPSEKRPYYTKESNNETGYTHFTLISGTITDLKLNLLPEDLKKLQNNLNVDTINFYIVRHGQSEHNKKAWMSLSGWGLQLDTSTTPEGDTQASNAAQELAGILGEQHIDTVFVSDLQRTRQTALALFNNKDIHLDNTKIVVLPCANELDTSGDGNGNCYEKSAKSLKPFRVRENYSACTIEKIQNNDNECSQLKSSNGSITIDWSLYLAFYDNKIRGYPKSNDIPNCGQTNMVSMAVYYLLNIHGESNPIVEYDRIFNNNNNNTNNNNNNNNNNNSIGGSKTRKRKHNIHNWITRRVRNKTKMKPRIKNKMKTKKKQRRYKK
jgi:broad specificity phosphatase PhoE